MVRLWTVIGVRDVARSFDWYLRLLGLPPAQPAHDHWGQLRDPDGTVVLCVHQWGPHSHPPLTRPALADIGNGLLLFFRVDDLAGALARARGLADALAEEPHLNPATGTQEFALRDPDGYYVMISAANA